LSSAGHILDMIKRIRQNKSIRPSNRQKFQENNRTTIYTGNRSDQKAIFKKFPKARVEQVIQQIRENARLEKRKELLLLLPIILAILFVIINLSSEEKPIIKDENDISYGYEPIEWCGIISDPIKIPNSEYFYVPVVEELERELNLNGYYKISPPNMAGDYTNNILFLDKDTLEVGRLLPSNGWISYMTFGPDENPNVPRSILYVLAEKDSNEDNYINHKDEQNVYISNLTGGNFTKITPPLIDYYSWIKDGCEIVFKFDITNRETDSIYGFYNIETSEMKRTNRLEEK